MTYEDLTDDSPDIDDAFDADDAHEWDEEDLGLDWNEADARRLVRDVIPQRDDLS